MSSNPVGTVLATKTVTNYKPAPIMAYFSSRGPAYSTKNILKVQSYISYQLIVDDYRRSFDFIVIGVA